MKTFTSTAHHEEGSWWLQCDQEPGAFSTGATLEEAVQEQREAISLVTGLMQDQIEVKVIIAD